jgi:glycosyltransferase involved in cell wall biosynthesis
LSATPGVKLLWHLHDFAPLGRFRRFLIALAIRSSDAIAAVSSDVGQSVCPGFPVHIVYNAMVPHEPNANAAPEHEGISDRTEKWITMGYLGRLHEEKGIPILLEAFQILNTDMENIRLIIAGEPSKDDNTTRNELETYAERLHIREKVSFTGRISNISRFYDTIDVFVLPAPREPFGLVILEALSHGCPVIACDAGGPHEILQDFSGAILVTPNDPSSLAKAMATMIRDNSYREFAEVHGPALIREAFSPAVQTRSIQSLYEELIA